MPTHPRRRFLRAIVVSLGIVLLSTGCMGAGDDAVSPTPVEPTPTHLVTLPLESTPTTAAGIATPDAAGICHYASVADAQQAVSFPILEPAFIPDGLHFVEVAVGFPTSADGTKATECKDGQYVSVSYTETGVPSRGAGSIWLEMSSVINSGDPTAERITVGEREVDKTVLERPRFDVVRYAWTQSGRQFMLFGNRTNLITDTVLEEMLQSIPTE